MTGLYEARFYEALADKKVLCTLCPHGCRLPNNGRGACSVRYNRDGSLYTLGYDKVVAQEVNPIEKKPSSTSSGGRTGSVMPPARTVAPRPMGSA